MKRKKRKNLKDLRPREIPPLAVSLEAGASAWSADTVRSGILFPPFLLLLQCLDPVNSLLLKRAPGVLW